MYIRFYMLIKCDLDNQIKMVYMLHNFFILISFMCFYAENQAFTYLRVLNKANLLYFFFVAYNKKRCTYSHRAVYLTCITL